MLALPVSSFGWANKGHRTVGRVAELFLDQWNAQQTQSRIQQILKDGETLSSVATNEPVHRTWRSCSRNALAGGRGCQESKQPCRLWMLPEVPRSLAGVY